MVTDEDPVIKLIEKLDGTLAKINSDIKFDRANYKELHKKLHDMLITNDKNIRSLRNQIIFLGAVVAIETAYMLYRFL